MDGLTIFPYCIPRKRIEIKKALNKKYQTELSDNLTKYLTLFKPFYGKNNFNQLTNWIEQNSIKGDVEVMKEKAYKKESKLIDLVQEFVIPEIKEIENDLAKKSF